MCNILWNAIVLNNSNKRELDLRPLYNYHISLRYEILSHIWTYMSKMVKDIYKVRYRLWYRCLCKWILHRQCSLHVSRPHCCILRVIPVQRTRFCGSNLEIFVFIGIDLWSSPEFNQYYINQYHKIIFKLIILIIDHLQREPIRYPRLTKNEKNEIRSNDVFNMYFRSTNDGPRDDIPIPWTKTKYINYIMHIMLN